jgi:putative IMPACT (imprinted ancient) family translation regulator
MTQPVHAPLKTVVIDLRTGRECGVEFAQYDHVVTDRGSVYAVSVGRVENREQIQGFLKRIKKDRRYASATHNSYAARVVRDGAVYETKGDEGEVGAGQVILRELQKADMVTVCVCVTRWFGGVKLMNDRYAHIQTVARYGLGKVR